MKSGVLHSGPSWAVAALFAATTLTAVGALPAAAAERAIVEMPAAVMTEGLTVDQYQQRQAGLSAQLLAELPPEALLNRVRVALDPDEIAAIDGADRSASPLRIGLVKGIAPVSLSGLDPDASADGPHRGPKGRAVQTRDGGWVWAMAIHAEGAGAVRLHLEDFSLPEGAELYVYTRDGEAYGPYTGTGPDESGEFWATTVFGSEAILQLRLSPGTTKASLDDVSFRVTEVGALTEKFSGSLLEASGFCGNATCIVDASCYSAASSIRDAYAKMEWVAGAYIYTCTGGLLNDSNPTQGNFFLTANHCFSKSATAKGVTFYWRFRTTSCNGSCPSNTGWPYKTTGSSVKATNRKGDFTLLQLNANPPAGSVFLGWTNTPVANIDGALLHRVSNPNFGPQVFNTQTVSTSAPVCRSWPRGERIYSRDTLGATDGGSSGSPVVNASDQVVGQLSGACGSNVNDPCDAVNNATVDGAFAYYWVTVQPFLQP
jgi:V8-like Glu-specific endopeptidase